MRPPSKAQIVLVLLFVSVCYVEKYVVAKRETRPVIELRTVEKGNLFYLDYRHKGGEWKTFDEGCDERFRAEMLLSLFAAHLINKHEDIEIDIIGEFIGNVDIKENP